MQVIYTIVLILSCAISAAAFLRAHRQLAPVFGLDPTHVGGIVIAPALGFFVVVATPAQAIIGAMMLTALGWWDDHRGVGRQLGLVLTLLACSIGIDGLPVPVFHPLPIPLAVLAIWLAWWGLTFTAEKLPRNLISCMLVAALALLPLAAAPVFTHAPHSLSLDIAMLGSAMLGALFIVNRQYEATLALRLPLVYIIGYGIFRAIIGGAWPFALASLLILAFLFLRPRHPGHAGAKVETFG